VKLEPKQHMSEDEQMKLDNLREAILKRKEKELNHLLMQR